MEHFEFQDVERMIAILAAASNPHLNLTIPERKIRLIYSIKELIQADIFIWCHSAFNPERLGDTTAAQIIDGGWLDDAEKNRCFTLLLDAKFNSRVHEVMHRITKSQKHETLLTEELIDDPEIKVEFMSLWNKAGFGSGMISTYPLDTDFASGIGLHRRIDKPPFTERERAIVHVIFQQVDWLHRDGLNLDLGKTVITLTPRERQVLISLMGSHSLKEIAKLLGIKRNTVDTYVKRIYRQLNVNSRPELMAQFMPSRTNPQTLV